MIIVSNAGNPLGLKLLICSKLGGRPVKLETATLSELPATSLPHLPTLRLPSGKEIFSVAQASKYLFPTQDVRQLSVVDQWWEWSMTLLAPLLHQPKSAWTTDLNASVLRLLGVVEAALISGQYIGGTTLTSADISIWVLLSHLVSHAWLLQQLPAVRAWFDGISELPQVKQSLAEYTATAAGLEQSNKYGGYPKHDAAKQSAEAPSVAASPISILDLTTEEDVSEREIADARTAFKYTEFVEVKEPRTVLPIPGKKNVLITSALPYVNNVPHLGNIIGCVLSADIFARYARSAGYNTLYICGTDEYGTATEAKAIAENLTPQQICDKYFELHNSIYRWFGIGFDYFGRTSTEEQTRITQEMFLDLRTAGLMDTQSVDQLLCTQCNRFLADRFVEGTCPHEACRYDDARGDQCDACGKLMNAHELLKPRCSVCRTTPEVRQSQQFFLNLPKIEPQLREWFASVEHGWSHNARVITKAWLKEGLRSRCITRDLKWGIPVPVAGFESKVFYVWFDAPIGYLSITARYTSEWKRWWIPQPADNAKVELYQFMAKDNVPFHSVMFPSALLGLQQGHTTVSHLMATEYLNYEDGKFSKSRGIGVFGNDAQDTGIPADVWRFYLASARPEGQDSNFSWTDLVTRNNSELLNNLGNFVNRALVFCEKFFGSVLAEVQLNGADEQLLALVNRECVAYVQAMEGAKFRDGIKHLLSVSRLGNQYLQSQQPWVLLKAGDAEKQRAGSVIALSCNLCCLLATLLFPYMPATSRTIFKQLNTVPRKINPESPLLQRYFNAGHVIGKPVPLFAKIEQSTLDELKNKYGGQQEKSKPTTEPTVASDQLNSREALVKVVAEQGEKVRLLKASGAEKTVWKPEVDTLLKLKKQLEGFVAVPAVAPKVEALSRDELVKVVAEQADKVRMLKASGAEKSTWKPDLDQLLKLKKQLEEFVGNPATTATVKSEADGTYDAVSKAVADQGEKVRKLKASGADKTVWKPEVDTLLKLKKQLEGLAAVPAVVSKEKAPTHDEIAKAVADQADKVRLLKASGAEKSTWKPEVDQLLKLKKQLEVFVGKP